MKLKKVLLRNIGAYYGTQNEIDLDTTNGQNVVLFGGKNGAGKTTLLESLRIALFGSLAYGFMTDNEAYYNRIRTIFNRKAVETGESTYQVILYYTAIENFVPTEYVLNRSWSLKNNKIKESFHVQRDGKELSDREIDNYQNRLREEIPPRLFELCLFDGEEISRIVSESQIPQYLNEAGKVLFNLDLFSNLERDLQTFKTHQIQKQDSSEDEKQKALLEEQLQVAQKKLSSLFTEMDLLSAESNQLKDLLAELKNDFEKHGGLQKDKREKLVTEVNSIENKRKHNTDQIREFVQTLLPLYMVRDLILETDLQMETEKGNESFEYVQSKLNSQIIKDILESTAKNNIGTYSDSLSSTVLENILDVIKPKDSVLIHRASFAQKSEVRELLSKINKVDTNYYNSLYTENSQLLEVAQTKRKQLEDNDKASEFKSILEDIENTSQLIEQKRMLIEQKVEEETLLMETIRQAKIDIEKIAEKLLASRKTENSFSMADKLIKVSLRFRNMQLRKKLDQVQNEAIKMIHKLFRKKDYVTRIYIDHETFELNLFKGHEVIVKERLSAGEKEMLMLSVIWAMFKCSGWRLPFVFDTLLGRLDQDHKRELIKQFIPNCGEQVIILSTDSEITIDQFQDLKPSISKCYTLEFNTIESKIEIHQDKYFNLQELELA
ncbi:DNA sulfur modification protein DndD [Paenibacillus roseipurpureus]|uniref:Nuclease SbcCD subunit C n=1 Tax=Paenibacillus roseopurpureus TaxID=2918901 RepID=A0AA96LNR4_9BACL|nr:DNA sulfur modification protein DndD [Paenibacillus sp. MBLB1832]WNR45135.1 DNA sulfur modification protein DndD [Paenibacillus sp. MBLB1832]